jgi:hypothetical protein
LSRGAEARRGGGTGLLLRSPALLLLCLAFTASVFAEPAATAEAAARRFALSAVRGPRADFVAAVDADAFLERRIGAEAWGGLTGRQKNLLRTVARERFAGMLAPPSPATATEIAWSEKLSSRSGLSEVIVGIAIGAKTLKTNWRLSPEGGGWRIEDVVLSDPGISLADATLATLGPEPVRRQSRLSRAGSQVVPWLALLAIMTVFLGVAAPRIAADRRRILYRAAAVPALIVIVGAIWATIRVVSQPYALHVEGAGAPSGPTAYERGIAARQRGETEAARLAFEEALAAPEPAPGAARELAAMALESGRLTLAQQRIASYLAAAGPDPDSLALDAVIQSSLGNKEKSVESIAAARRLLGPGPRAAELEAKIRARASDAAGAVAALRPLVDEKAVTREALRSDPAYLPIATDPAWVKFLNQKESR